MSTFHSSRTDIHCEKPERSDVTSQSRILSSSAINPHASSREMGREIGISRTSVLRILHRHHIHPFHISLHQALDDNDFQIRPEYSQRVLHHGHDFMSGILFTDEATFTNHGM